MNDFKLHDTLNKILALSFEERNVMYFKLKDIIEKTTPDESARTILSVILDLLNECKAKIENEVLTNNVEKLDSNAEVKEFKGSFRRVP